MISCLCHFRSSPGNIPGAFELTSFYVLTSLTDYTIFSKQCGGLESFRLAQTRFLGIRVLLGFLPLILIIGSSKNYNPFSTLKADTRWRRITADVPWIADTCDVSVFFLGHATHWDTVPAHSVRELTRLDPDISPHYQFSSVAEGTIVADLISNPCGFMSREFQSSPFFVQFMCRIWAKIPNAIVWMQYDVFFAALLANSVTLPMNSEFRIIMQASIEHSIVRRCRLGQCAGDDDEVD
jgi:hypothetical protein